jgi:branched-chain amino acid transport system substrate-binding protein
VQQLQEFRETAMIRTTKMISVATILCAVLTGPVPAQQPATPLKIGVLSDFSSVYSDIGGMGNVEATKMAIEDFGGSIFGKPVELVTADVLNKADVAASIARKWYGDEGVDIIIDCRHRRQRSRSWSYRSNTKRS